MSLPILFMGVGFVDKDEHPSHGRTVNTAEYSLLNLEVSNLLFYLRSQMLRGLCLSNETSF